jgi:hypothetical protein
MLEEPMVALNVPHGVRSVLDLDQPQSDGMLDVSRRQVSIRDDAALRAMADQQACHYAPGS